MSRSIIDSGRHLDHRNSVAAGLLIDAGAVLATSLDLTATMGQVARLTVPRLADLCVIDLRDEDGSIRDVAVAAADEEIPNKLEELRGMYPLDPYGQHPVARVIRSGEPELLPTMTGAQLSSFAESSEHAKFMIDHGYRSAVVAPLLARGRTLGALSVLRLGEGGPYRQDDLELASELARRAALAIDNARLYSEVRRAQLAESFMAEASSVLASSMDYGETLQRVAQLAVPQIADWCAVDLVDDRGAIERVAVYHADPAKLALAQRLDRVYRPTLDEPVGIPEVIRTGQARIFTDIKPEQLAAYARNPEHLQLLRATGTNAVIIVPLAGPTRTLGTIMLVSSEATRHLTHADLALAVRLGRRAGTAVENARLYTERTRIAHTLQQSLLPESLPEVPGTEIRALYSAAGELNEVGGDFYDVFQYGTDSWMLVIGDVCGKGPRAAGVTALTRHTLRATAMSGQSPTEMLRTLHQALKYQPVGADLCTVCLVTMTRTPEYARLTVALAGHQPPLLIGRDGEATQIGQTGTLLGVIEPIDITEREARLNVGETLLLYTDGVPDAGRPGRQLGEHGLVALCAQAPHLTPSGLLKHIERAALERASGRLRDDIAMLAVRVGPASE
jgi:serine phosphatase RsbU (regulator of sigma subunit)